MKKGKRNLSKTAILSALAISVGTAAQASEVNAALKDPLFSLKEVNTQSILIAQEPTAKTGEVKAEYRTPPQEPEKVPNLLDSGSKKTKK